MPGVRSKNNESFDALLRRFKRAVERDGVMQELRTREFFVRPGERKRREKIVATKRHQKKIRDQQLVKKRLF